MQKYQLAGLANLTPLPLLRVMFAALRTHLMPHSSS
jgi:hypothetical protein